MSAKTYITIGLGLILLYLFYSVSSSNKGGEIQQTTGTVDTAYYFPRINDYWLEIKEDQNRYYLEDVDSTQASLLSKAKDVELHFTPATSWFGMNEDVIELRFLVSGTDTVYSRKSASSTD